MTKQISILLFTLSFLFSSFCFSQKSEGRIIYTDGKVREGYVKLNGAHFVKFKSVKKAKAEKVDFSELASVEIKNDDEVSIYKNISVVGKDEPLVLEEVVKGAVTLYNLNTQGFSSVFAPSGMGGAPLNIGPMTYDIKNLYVLRTGEEKATHLGSNQLFTKNFKTAASVFFKDCTSLVTKIQNKDFKKKHIKEIVQYYNSECK
ncbi:hypothetical protein [Cellulophaga baltica]|uniref:hypothetical protein n=1 Tax=Cellulophaga baltica TaxID=76594 RepID=UPI0004288F1C|nr:hypothetical protein [Cellulophaga baltica]